MQAVGIGCLRPSAECGAAGSRVGTLVTVCRLSVLGIVGSRPSDCSAWQLPSNLFHRFWAVIGLHGLIAVPRQLARHVELPEWHRSAVRPWTAQEAKRFMAASRTDLLHNAFVLLIIYGLRRGEVLGLSWDDIDFDTGTIHVRQQIRRVRGELQLGPVKTHAGQRTLPLFDLARQALAAQANRQAAYQADMGSAWQGTGLIFTTRTGRPVEPRNFVRSFRRICEANDIRVIKVHHIRHTVASLLKDLRVPARDAQAILGHTRISTTLEIYTDSADEAKHDALTRLHGLFDDTQQAPTATEDSYKPGSGDQEG
jgi:integrase